MTSKVGFEDFVSGIASDTQYTIAESFRAFRDGEVAQRLSQAFQLEEKRAGWGPRLGS